MIDRCTELSMVKIATWNVNGLRSLIRDYGNIENVLSLFDGDIVSSRELTSIARKFLGHK